MNKKIALISNSLFLLGATFIFSMIWTRYFLRDLVVSLILSVAASIVTLYIFLYFSLRRDKFYKISKAENNRYDDFFNFVLLSNPSVVWDILSRALDHCKKVNDFVIEVTNMDSPFYLYNLTGTAVVCKDNIIGYIKANLISPSATGAIVVIDIDSDAKTFILDYLPNIDILDCKDLYTIFTTLNIMPKDMPKCEKKHSTMRSILRLAISHHLFKNYILSSIVVALSSIFVRFKIYYLIFSTILLALAFASYFNKPKTKSSKTIDYLLK